MTNLFFLILLCLCSTSSIEPTMQKAELIIKAENIKPLTGNLQIAIYKSEEDFLNVEKVVLGKIIPIDQNPMRVVIDDLPFGKYAIALHHDTNGDGEMTTNFFGIPTEPFGFSNNIEIKWRKPRFKETSFEFSSHQQVIPIKLNKWKNL